MLTINSHTNLKKLSTVALILFLSPNLWAYSGGTGTPEDPFQIATTQGLIDLGQTPDDYDKSFVLTADIDLQDFSFIRAVIAPDMNDTTWLFQEALLPATLTGRDT